MSTPSVVAREYNPNNGALIGNITSLSFGNVPVGTRSPTKVIDLAFTGVVSASNVRLALLTSGSLAVNDSPSPSPNEDGSDPSSGYFGIGHSANFLPSHVPSTYFLGAYTPEGSPTNAVSIPTRDVGSTITQYVYLDVRLGSANIGANGGSYRILFDYV